MIHVPNMRTGYAAICDAVLTSGDDVSPRGMKTRELLDVVIRLDDPGDALPLGTGRALNVAIGVVEALSLISGKQVPQLAVRVAPNMAQFLDGGVFHGAYGPRARPQLPHVLRKLEEDSDTRQAVVTLWDPLYDNGAARDIPCTTMLQFLVRRDKLVMHTTMRSNDVWWGLAYDVFQFTQLQLAVANALGVEAGTYYHHAVSLHAYERDWEGIESLAGSGAKDQGLASGLCSWQANTQLRTPGWEDVVRSAGSVLLNGTVLPVAGVPHCDMRTEHRMVEILEKYR